MNNTQIAPVSDGLVLDGKALAQAYHAKIAAEVSEIKEKKLRAPGLAVILVGADPASQTYVRTKSRVAKECGFELFDATLAADTSDQELLLTIDRFNQDKSVDGILLQLPLPNGRSAAKFIERIDPSKDADGLHPLNQGRLFGGVKGVVPCTPFGVMKLIDHSFSGSSTYVANRAAKDLSGLNAVVVGRSVLVGKPVAALLLDRNATVTIAHSRTANLSEVISRADIVVAAVGKAGLVKGEWIKSGATVIDVGTNRTAEGKLVGDVEFISAKARARAITPVPGGVGPMTVAMLMWNTLLASKNIQGIN